MGLLISIAPPYVGGYTTAAPPRYPANGYPPPQAPNQQPSGYFPPQAPMIVDQQPTMVCHDHYNIIIYIYIAIAMLLGLVW